MSTYANIYTGGVNSGYQDGDVVSETHSLTAPITADFTVTKNRTTETQVIKCAIRCIAGYQTYGTTTLTLCEYNNGTYTPVTSSNWQICLDNGYIDGKTALNNGSWSNTSITIADIVTDVNAVFWLKATATITESTSTDTSIAILHEETIDAVG